MTQATSDLMVAFEYFVRDPAVDHLLEFGVGRLTGLVLIEAFQEGLAHRFRSDDLLILLCGSFRHPAGPAPGTWFEPAQVVANAMARGPGPDGRGIAGTRWVNKLPAVRKPARIAVDGRDSAHFREQHGVILVLRSCPVW